MGFLWDFYGICWDFYDLNFECDECCPLGGYRSCLELRERAGKTEDGSYALLVGGRNISIYCHNMNSSMPKEYLNLITGHIDNYAEVYDKT